MSVVEYKRCNDLDLRTDKTITAYNRNAEPYLTKFADFQPYRDMITLFHHHYMKESTRILDLGCGPGHNTSLLLDLDSSREITGIDLSDTFIDIARQREPRATFLRQDIRFLDVGEQKYDTVIASFCIVHLTSVETESFIDKIATIVSEDGYLYLSFMEGSSSGFEKTSFSKDEIYFQYHQVSHIERILLESGMVVRQTHTSDYLEESGDTTQDIFMFVQKKSR